MVGRTPTRGGLHAQSMQSSRTDGRRSPLPRAAPPSRYRPAAAVRATEPAVGRGPPPPTGAFRLASPSATVATARRRRPSPPLTAGQRRVGWGGERGNGGGGRTALEASTHRDPPPHRTHDSPIAAAVGDVAGDGRVGRRRQDANTPSATVNRRRGAVGYIRRAEPAGSASPPGVAMTLCDRIRPCGDGRTWKRTMDHHSRSFPVHMDAINDSLRDMSVLYCTTRG